MIFAINVSSQLQRLNENLSGDVLDDVPTLKLEKGRQRGPTTPNTSGI